MLAYLIEFVKNNIILILFIMLIFCITSLYSKKIRNLFVICIGLGVFYIALLGLYQFGIGIDFLYNFSCKWITLTCLFLEKVVHSDNLIQLLTLRSVYGIYLIFGVILVLIMSTYFVVISFPKKCKSVRNKSLLNFHSVNRQEIRPLNTNIYLLNSSFRC